MASERNGKTQAENTSRAQQPQADNLNSNAAESMVKTGAPHLQWHITVRLVERGLHCHVLLYQIHSKPWG
jgi:hypothetical protein